MTFLVSIPVSKLKCHSVLLILLFFSSGKGRSLLELEKEEVIFVFSLSPLIEPLQECTRRIKILFLLSK